MYLHSDHAGNKGDLVKHPFYIHCLNHFLTRAMGADKVCIIETHVGAPVNMTKAKNIEDISTLFTRKDFIEDNRIYTDEILAVNDPFNLRRYPGSSTLTARVIKQHPFIQLSQTSTLQYMAFDTHPSVPSAIWNMLHTVEIPRVHCTISEENGWPQAAPRADTDLFLFVDPPYVDFESDMRRVMDSALSFNTKRSTALYWFPILRDINYHEKYFQHFGPNCQLLVAEWPNEGIAGCGLLLVDDGKSFNMIDSPSLKTLFGMWTTLGMKMTVSQKLR